MMSAMGLLLSVALVALILDLIVPHDAGAAEQAIVRVISDDFVLPGRLDKLAGIATQNGVALDRLYVEKASGEPQTWLTGVDLVILDTPRPMDAAKVEQRLGASLKDGHTPWIKVGGGPPGFGNLSAEQGRRLIGYYAGGGAANLGAMFGYLKALRDGGDLAALPAPVPLPQTGFYHPAASKPFASITDYLQWGASRWKPGAPRVAFLTHPGQVSGLETEVIDAMIAGSESKGLAPIAVWFDAGDPDALQKAIGMAKVDAIVIATHLQNGPARAAEFLKLNVPVLQTIGFRDGDAAAFAEARSGISQRLAAPFLALPEGWGASDPIVADALENGEPRPLPRQIDALLDKIVRLAALRGQPAVEKHLALMFWNYPPGEKNLSASNLNVPRSLHDLTAALAHAGYDIPALREEKLIDVGQRMLHGLYYPEALPDLRDAGLAVAFPVRRYQAWLATLPEARRAELLARWGDPEKAASVFDIDGEKQFVIPRYQAGKLLIMPQPPRGAAPGANYHDASAPPPHAYLATYLLLRESSEDALIHFGTHGTQEWTPGKDRGLSVDDYPFLAVGDLPVFYPYTQDNIAEAVQAKRRGRAVTISHQTPPFAPAGLYDELRDLHAKIHEYIQLDEGAVRDKTSAEIRAIALKSNMSRDMGWDERRMTQDFAEFLKALHEHVHELARQAMPLGLHTFGEPASPDLRLATVMQQLGRPFYRLLDPEPDEFFATDFKALETGKPYQVLKNHLRDGKPLDDAAAPELKAMMQRAAALDRHLAETGEIEALLNGLAGGLVLPGSGGDPIRNPDVPSGRNLYPFEPDKIPTHAAYDAGDKALAQLIDAYRNDHRGGSPTKLAFSLWSSETMRHLGIQESQILHALGLKPIWDAGGRLVALDIIPRSELGRPRIDTVLQVTSVYRDQFDGFMRLLADAIGRLAVLDEPDNPIAGNTHAVVAKLIAQGQAPERARTLASLRVFSNAPGDYGTNLPASTLQSAAWTSDAPLADAYLDRMQYAYGGKDWGTRIDGANLFAEQLHGVQAAILSRSSKLYGLLSTDHPFEYLGGLALAIRRLDGKSPSLYISDLREQEPRTAQAERFLADEMRTRTLNPHWIQGMQNEGYAGTLEVLNAVNNLWGWQVSAPETVRADQWQAVHDTFIRDVRHLDVNRWFERQNAAAQAQIIARMVEAIRKGYWDAPRETRQELAERWRQLSDRHGAAKPEDVTQKFMDQPSSGFGLGQPATSPSSIDGATSTTDATEQVSGNVLKPADPDQAAPTWPWSTIAAACVLLALVLAGWLAQSRINARCIAMEQK
jgi:cobaltochelatase CobN